MNQCGRNFRIVSVTPCKEHGGNRRCHARAIRQTSIEQRFRFANVVPERSGDALDGVHQVLRLDHRFNSRHETVSLGEDRSVTVDHDLGNTGIENDVLDRLQERKNGFE